jgi:superfamily II DNA or RNA helicase
MSIKIPIDNLSYEQKYKVDNELEIKIENSNKFGPSMSRSIYPYDILNDDVMIPFGFGCGELKLVRPTRESFPTFDSLVFGGSLRDEQKAIKKEALRFLSSTGSVIISAYPGFGKTCTSINMAIGIGFKTLIIVNKIVLINQWKDSIIKFCPDASIQIVTAKSKKHDVHFYIVNAINVPKLHKTFFSDIGTVIVDEIHLIMAESLSKSLMTVFPRYLLGLSATPYRPDSLDKLIDIYFGPNKVCRKLLRHHIAYKVKTNFKPEIQYSSNGKMNWSALIDDQANNYERNELIIKLILLYSDRNFLVLVKRISQGEYLLNRLIEYGENVTSLLGDNQEFNRESRILVATGQKCGTGFDHDKMDTLLLASDFEEYFVQYLGRIFRKTDTEPIVYDLVDKNGILEKHFKTRKEIYLEHGGKVKYYDLNNLNFEVEIQEEIEGKQE